MLGYNGNGAISTVYSPKLDNYNLYSPEKNLVLTEGYAKPGTYDMIILQLDKTTPLTYYNKGVLENIGFSDSSYESIYIKHKFKVESASDIEQVIIDFNLSNSISESSNDYVFNPKYKAFSVSETTAVAETLFEKTGAKYVCAYLLSNAASMYSMPLTTIDKSSDWGDSFTGFGPGVHAKIDIEAMGSKDKVDLDSARCENAYDIRPVDGNGKYEFPT